MLTTVIANNRTVLLNEVLTIRQAKDEVASKGMRMSLRRTLQFYGLHYVEDRSFISRYRDIFNLSDSKTMYDISLHELRLYKDRLVGRTLGGMVYR